MRADLKHALHLLRENAGRVSGGHKEFGLMLDESGGSTRRGRLRTSHA
jgi:hypothetical protein